MFTDTHCHILKEDYDIETVLDNAKKSGITKMINNGCDLKTNGEVLELARKYDGLYASIGFHPQNISHDTLQELDYISKHASEIVAIGEIGLDYYNGNEDHELQKNILIKQMELAEKLSLPVIIHSRNATEDTIKILKMFPAVKGSIHCFSGSYETAQIYLKMGYKLGINGVLTFKNSNLYKVIERLSLDDLLLETDSPYLTPEPHRGEKNEPANVIFVAKRIAEIKNCTLEEVSEASNRNVRNLFDI